MRAAAIKLNKAVAAFVAMVCLVGVLNAVTAKPANAVIGLVYLVNNSRNYIKIYCSYGSKYYKILNPGENSQQRGKCTADHYDTDQVVVYTMKCMKYVGPHVPDGWYWLSSDVRYKISDFAKVGIYNPRSECNGRPHFNRF